MATPIGPDLFHHLVSVSSPSLAPDGSRMVFARSCVDGDTGEVRSSIVMADLSAGEPFEFTSGRNDSTPRFSFDGRCIAFLRADDREKRQIWLIPVSGGEASKLTSLEGGVFQFSWSPDSEHLVAVSDVDPDRLPVDHDQRRDPRVKVARRIRYRADTLGWRGDAFRHLFVLDTKTGDSRQITHGEGEDSTPEWSPVGRQIAFISDRGDNREVSSESALYVVDEAGGELEKWSSGLFNVSAFTWSADGESILAVGSDDPACTSANQGWLFILRRGKDPLKITDDSVAPVGGNDPVVPAPKLRWTKENSILFLAGCRGQTHLFEAAGDGKLRQVTAGAYQIADISLDDSAATAAALIVAPASPGDIHLVDMAKGSTRRITDLNRDYLDEHPPASCQRFAIVRGGLEIESWLWFPPGFDESAKHPMILVIHGGPHGSFYDAFAPTHQVLATSGYVVLAVNPRGSSTYGATFMKAVLNDWGGEDCSDIMAALDEACARPYIDSERLGIAGYSYGGFMTSWIVGHEDRFKAAVVGAPVTNLSSMYGTSDIGVRFGELQWGGSRKDMLERYVERSPLTYASNVTTPVLLMHGESDVRCPIEQSEQYFVALKRLGKEVEFVRFPGCSHAFLRKGHPKLKEQYLTRMLGWMDRFVSAKVA